jgi:hypothetical protein
VSSELVKKADEICAKKRLLKSMFLCYAIIVSKGSHYKTLTNRVGAFLQTEAVFQ